MRSDRHRRKRRPSLPFLSSLAQDFIEEVTSAAVRASRQQFLSSLAQDFIEEYWTRKTIVDSVSFLSSLAQDFIEEQQATRHGDESVDIPELSSSGLH